MNSCQIRRLPDGELEVMMIIWEAAEPISASAILQQLAGSRSWVLSSLITVLNRLTEMFTGAYIQCGAVEATAIGNIKVQAAVMKK